MQQKQNVQSARNPQHHTQKVSARFQELIDHLRSDIEKIDDPRAKAMLQLLLNDIIPNELRAPLPLRFRPAQDLALAELLVYAAIIDHLGVRDTGLVVGL